MESNWFSDWFDSQYYHILYQHRDQDEANSFIDQLTQHLKPASDAKVLDLACGKGRHSIYLNRKGLNVIGVDLSGESIRYAQQFENADLKFLVGDMREPLSEKFDFIFNLFTSFGYFDDRNDDIRVLKAVHQMLEDDGTFVLDFFNTQKIVADIVPEAKKEAGGIQFDISKAVKEGRIVKDIRFRDNGMDYHFTERVSAIYLEDFKGYFQKAGFEMINVWGSYDLSAYDSQQSSRMIFCLKKS